MLGKKEKVEQGRGIRSAKGCNSQVRLQEVTFKQDFKWMRRKEAMQVSGGKCYRQTENSYCNCAEAWSLCGHLKSPWRLVWWEHSEWAGKLGRGEVRGNLFYCYWFTGWDLQDLVKTVLMCNSYSPSRMQAFKESFCLVHAASPTSSTEPGIQQMPSKFLCEWTIQRPFIEYLLCATPGANP